jgi:uncharacterized Zn finger protein
MGFFGWRPYVPVARRQWRAQQKIAEMKKKGQSVAPVTIEGRAIARSFWGKSWCDNLESYSDYENRLPRGRTYVRNGSVVDLQIGKGKVAAWVSGSELYQVKATIAPVKAARWKAICRDCAGTIESLVELLQGRLAKGVMDRVCRKGDGLFPAPSEIELSCSCPDWAGMCKHVAAALYGVGARLDHKPELLFVLRGVDESDLLARAGADLPLANPAPANAKVLGDGDVAALFGIDMAAAGDDAAPVSATATRTPAQRRKAAAEGAAPAAMAGKRSAAARGKTPVRGARKASSQPMDKDDVGTARMLSPAIPDKNPEKLARDTLSAETRKGRAKIDKQIEKIAATKTAAAKAGQGDRAGRSSRSKSKPKWAASARARKQRMRRSSRRSA